MSANLPPRPPEYLNDNRLYNVASPEALARVYSAAYFSQSKILAPLITQSYAMLAADEDSQVKLAHMFLSEIDRLNDSIRASASAAVHHFCNLIREKAS